MTPPQQLSPQARERFQQPRNYGPLDRWDGHACLTGPCGDTMEFWLQIAEGRIQQANFTTTGCGSSRAAGSMATELAIGKRLEEATRLAQHDVLRALGGLPAESEHCALLAANTLKAAIAEHEARQRTAQRCGECSDAQCSSKQRRPEESEQEFHERQVLTQRMCRIRHKLLVMSGKGGVGKSTVAANLAISLAAAGHEVGLLDVDIHGPSIPQLMGLDGGRLLTHGEELVPVQAAPNLKVISIGFLLASSRDAVIWRGPMKYGVIRQFLKDVAWGPLDYLIIDSPPGTGDEPLSVAQLVGRPAGAILVTTPQELAVADVRRSVSFCERVALPVVGIIENLSGLACPHCGGQIELFKTGGGAMLAREMGVPFLGRIPIDPQIVASGDDGRPYVKRFAASPAAKAFAAAVQLIVNASADEDLRKPSLGSQDARVESIEPEPQEKNG